MKKLAIIGGGVAGMSASLYALRANAEVTVFDPYGLGGLVTTIDKIENYPTIPSINGFDLAMNLAEQVKNLGVKVITERVISLDKKDDDFVIKTDKGEYLFKSVVVATGTSHNKLGFEQPFVGKGVSYCATCDGNFYKNKVVAVVGGNGHAVSEALYLSNLCKTVYVICPNGNLSGDVVNVNKLVNSPKVTVIYNTSVTDILGESSVKAITLDNESNPRLDVDGVFVATGATPITSIIKCNVNLSNGYVVVDDKCMTNVEGLFSAGDVTNGSLKQIVTACADGAKAGTFACVYLQKVSKD